MARPENPYIPKYTGWRRLFKAADNSLAGLTAAFRNEEAFRIEVILGVLLIPLALIIPATAVERALLIGSTLFVMIVELLNSAIEAVVDRISLERHPLSKQAKDIGSAAVLLAVLVFLATWGLIVVG
jgi:diacylglycerol kinase (ATP)